MIWFGLGPVKVFSSELTDFYNALPRAELRDERALHFFHWMVKVSQWFLSVSWLGMYEPATMDSKNLRDVLTDIYI